MADSRVPDRLAPLALPDLTGRRVVITGASSGIGLATATAMGAAGAELVLGVRNPAKGEAAARRIRAAGARATPSVELVELGSLSSIAEFATRVGSAPVDLLINNAGLSTDDPSATTEDGFDKQVGVNYLGAYALTAGLWPALAAAAGRVVMLGSMLSARGQVDDRLGLPTGSTFRSYSDSKLATVVFAGELRRRCHAAGVPVTAVAAHPGWCQTAIFATAGPPAWTEGAGRLIGALQSPADGAQPVLLAATDPHPAAFYGPAKRWGACGPARGVRLPAAALVPGLGETLLQVSALRTGITLELAP